MFWTRVAQKKDCSFIDRNGEAECFSAVDVSREVGGVLGPNLLYDIAITAISLRPVNLPDNRKFEATEARTLRVVLSGFYDMASVVARTFLEFDGGDEDQR